MAFTLDLDTDRGKVRLLIQDDIEAYEFYSDAKVDAFLAMADDLEGARVFNAAALALDSWASNQVMILKVVTILDVKTDGAKVAQEMRARAATLRAQAKAASADSGLTIAEMDLGHFSWVEQVENKALRDAL